MSDSFFLHQYQQAVGIVIRKYRELTGYSQEAFANQVGIHRTYLGAIERGERNLTLRNLLRISTALKIPLSTITKEAENHIPIKKKGEND